MVPKVSIVTPSYNQAQFIEQTIQSVRRQDYPNIEHIVIDGGSTDGTLDILNKYNQHITWISETDNGQTHAINKGFRMATGTILTWINSDDFLLPKAVSTVVDTFAKHPNVGFVYGDYYVVDSNGKTLFFRKTIQYDKNVLVYGRSLISQPASFFKRTVIETIGYLNEKYDYCMDMEFWIRATLNGITFTNIQLPLAATRLHISAKTATQRAKLYEQHKQILNSYGLLKFQNNDSLNKLNFHLLHLFFRLRSTINRIIQRRDWKILAGTIAIKTLQYSKLQKND